MNASTRLFLSAVFGLAAPAGILAQGEAGGIPQEIVNKVNPSVVAIKHERAQGSGFVLSADGYILTNGHVVRGEDPEDPLLPAEAITVVLHDDRKFPARVLGFWMDPDVALIKIDPDHPLVPVECADSRAVRTGQRCFAVGNPMGLKRTFTSGVLSNVERTDLGTETRVLQTDAAINPGNSGGPLFDLEGRVLGVNTYGISGGNSLGFTLPVHVVLPVKDRILKSGRFIRGEWPFVSFGELDDDLSAALGVKSGVLVHHVEPGSPAGKAGLRTGDVVVSVDGRPVAARSRAEALDFEWEHITLSPPGRTMEFGVVHPGQDGIRTVRVTVTEASPMPRTQRHSGELREFHVDVLGLGVTDLVPLHRFLHNLGDAKGVLVSSLAKESTAAKAGLRENDILSAVDGRKVDGVASFHAALAAALARQAKAFEIEVVRGALRFPSALSPDYAARGKQALVLTAAKDWAHLDVLQMELAAAGCRVDTIELAAPASRTSAAAARVPDVLVVAGTDRLPAELPGDLAKTARAVQQTHGTLAAAGEAAALLLKAVPDLAGRKMTTANTRATALIALGADYTGMDVETDDGVVTTTARDRKVTRAFIRAMLRSVTGGSDEDKKTPAGPE